jgi:hypothetical protein
MNENSVKIHVNELEIGMKIRLPKSWIEHPFWKNKITIKSMTEIQIIKNIDIKYVDLLNAPISVYKETTPSVEENENRQTEATSVEQITFRGESNLFLQDEINLRIEESKTVFEQFTDRLDEITNLIIRGNPSAKDKFSMLVLNLVDFSQSRTKRELISIPSVGGYYPSTQQAVSSALFSIILTKSMNHPVSELKKVCTTSLLLGIKRFASSGANEINKEYFDLKMQKFIDSFTPQEIITESLAGNAGDKVENNIFYHTIRLTMDFVNFFNSDYSKPAKILLGTFFKKNNSPNATEQKILNLIVKLLGIYPPGTYIRLKKYCIAKVVMSSSEIDNPYVIKCSIFNSDLEIIQLADIRPEVLDLLSNKDVPSSVSKKLDVSMRNYIFI